VIRSRTPHRHRNHDTGCGCHGPVLRQVSRRLDTLTRRGFLTGAGAAIVAGAMPRIGLAQTSPILFRQVRLFDGLSDTLRTGVQILVEGNRIVAIDTTNSAPPEGATIIDCGDRVLMPGLIDAHWHTIFAATPINVLMMGDPGIIFAGATAEAERTLLRGFTTVRDLGGPTFSFKQAIDSGIIPGPRIFPSGALVTTSGGHGDLRMPFEMPRGGGELSLGEQMGAAAIADGVAEVQLRVREQLLQGASQVKMMAGGGVSSPRSPLDITTFSEAELAAGVGVARDWNTYVTAHAYMSNTVQRAMAAGCACIEHAHLMDEATAQIMADKEIWLSTQPFLSMEDASSQSGPGVERAMQIFEGTPRIYEFARKYGIKTAWGSDVLFAPELAPRQNVMLTHLKAWYSNAEILRMATSTNAELLALSGPRTPYAGRLGVIEKDALADLLVVDGNPIEDISLIEDPGANLAIVMKDGTIFKNML
jgi:imidazolonepropionase-like amidohydrolase